MEPYVNIVSSILLFSTIVYVVQIFRYVFGLNRLQAGENTEIYTVTVLIPARNEEKNIYNCVTSILNQNYPAEKFHIIVIDDQSSDSTSSIVQKLINENPNRITLLHVNEKPAGVSPKINALLLGITNSKSEIIMTTDADCTASCSWISSTVRYFEENVGATTGLTLFSNELHASPLIHGFQFIDFISFTACGAGSIGYGRTTTCNGSNMAFRRSAYDEVGGYGAIASLNSGDDSLLAQKIEKTKNWKVTFVNDPISFVTTISVQTWKEILLQRMRWAAQTTQYPTGTVIFMSITFIFYILLFISLPISIFLLEPSPWLAFAAKCGIDLMLLNKFTTMTRTRSLLRYFLPSAFIHIALVIAAVFGGYITKFEWKERKIGRSG